jgi:hypothetical protein
MSRDPFSASGGAMSAADHPNSRRRFFLLVGHAGAAAAATATLANGLRATAGTSIPGFGAIDPILALIEEHRRAIAYTNERGTTDDETARRVSLEDDVLWRLVQTEPPTLASAQLLLHYIVDFDNGCEPEPEVYCTAMKSVAAALARMEARHG